MLYKRLEETEDPLEVEKIKVEVLIGILESLHTLSKKKIIYR